METYSPATTDQHILVPSFKSGGLLSIGTLLFILLSVWFTLYQQRPPATVSAGAPLEMFSSGRAMKHLKAICATPHPMGTHESAEVREYVITALRMAGLNVEVQQTTAVNTTRNGVARLGTVHNVVAKLKGTEENGKAILLVSHYDSVPSSFGASDDGAGVAAMLETLRALTATVTPRRSDVIFLFTDGEENGLLGAQAFVNEHRWAKDVGLVLNFEARGNGGPSIMFETSDENAWLIREFAKAAPHPVANSLAYEIYKLLPNDTDLTVFKQAGFAGLNFAFIEGVSHYHTVLDRFEQIDERSLQHHGSHALALTRHFANLDLNDRKETNAIYFDIFGATLVHYPGAWAIPLSLLSIILFVVLAVVGLRKNTLTLKGMGFGFIAVSGAMFVAAGVTSLIWMLVSRSQSVTGFRPGSEIYQENTYLLGFMCLAIAIVTALDLWFLKKTRMENLLAGGMLWWVILTVVSSVYLPGASYLFLWPLLFSMLGLCLMLVVSRDRRSERKLLPVAYLCAMPAIILGVPAIYQMFQGLGLNMIGPIMLAVALLCALLIPHIRLITREKKWILPGIAALVGVGFIAAGLLNSGASRSQPKLDNLLYALDADTGKAVWASLDKEPDEWTTQFLSSNTKSGTLPAILNANTTAQWLQGDAQAQPLVAPDIKLLEETSIEGMRILRMHITSPRQAPVLTFYADSKMEIVSVEVNGKLMNMQASVSGARKDSWTMRYYAVPVEGIDMTMHVKALEPVKFRVVDQSYQLPQFMGARAPSRSDNIISAPLPFADSTFVSRSFTF
jgi:hypothetical protein